MKKSNIFFIGDDESFYDDVIKVARKDMRMNVPKKLRGCVSFYRGEIGGVETIAWRLNE